MANPLFDLLGNVQPLFEPRERFDPQGMEGGIVPPLNIAPFAPLPPGWPRRGPFWAEERALNGGNENPDFGDIHDALGLGGAQLGGARGAAGGAQLGGARGAAGGAQLGGAQLGGAQPGGGFQPIQAPPARAQAAGQGQFDPLALPDALVDPDFAAHAIQANRQPGVQVGRGGTRHKNAQDNGFISGANPKRTLPGDGSEPEKRFTVPKHMWPKGANGQAINPGPVSQAEWHALQKQWVAANGNNPLQRDVLGSPTRNAMSAAHAREAEDFFRSRANTLASQVAGGKLTAEQAYARLQEEARRYMRRASGDWQMAPGGNMDEARVKHEAEVQRIAEHILSETAAGMKMPPAGQGGVQKVAANFQGAGEKVPPPMLPGRMQPPGEGALKPAPGPAEVKPQPQPMPIAGVEAKPQPGAGAGAAGGGAQPGGAQPGGVDPNVALAAQMMWLRWLADRGNGQPGNFIADRVPFGGFRDLQGVTGGAIDSLDRFIDNQNARGAGPLMGGWMQYPKQLQGLMGQGMQMNLANQNASVELKKAAAQLAAARAQAAAAADVGRSNAFGQAFSSFGGAFQERAKRQYLNPILAMLAAALGRGGFGGEGGMFNRKLPIGVNLSAPHYTPATTSMHHTVGRIV